MFREFEYTTELTGDTPAIRDHRVYEVRMFPGMAYLDIVYSLLATEGYDMAQVELRNLLFKQPIGATTGEGALLSVRLVNEGPVSHIIADSRRTDAPADAPWHENMRCELHATTPLEERLDVAALEGGCQDRVDLEEAYAQSRRIGIVHYPYMQCRGYACRAADHVTGRLRLTDQAAAEGAECLLHPAFLDTAVLFPYAVKGFDVPNDETFIPFFIKSFRVLAPMRGEYLVHVRQPEHYRVGTDLFQNDLWLCDPEGRVQVWIMGMTAKRVRSRDLILRHEPRSDLVAEQTAQSDQAPPAPAAPASPPSTPAAGDTGGWVAGLVATRLGMAPDTLARDRGFYDLGLDSSQLLQLAADLERALGTELYPTLLFEHNTIAALAAWLDAHQVQVPAAAAGSPPPAAPAPPMPARDTAGWLAGLIASRVNLAPDAVDRDKGFYDLGLDSSQLLGLAADLERALGTELYPTLLFEYNTVGTLAAWLDENTSGALAAAPAPAPAAAEAQARPAGTPAPAPAAAPTLYYRPQWVPAPLPAPRTGAAGDTLLLICLDAHLEGDLSRALAGNPDRRLLRVQAAAGYQAPQGDRCGLDIRDHGHYRRLLEHLGAAGQRLSGVLLVATAPRWEHGDDDLNKALDSGLYPLQALSRALLEAGGSDPVSLFVAYREPETGAVPPLSALEGFARTLHRESPRLATRLVAHGFGSDAAEVAATLAAEVRVPPREVETVRMDGGQRLAKLLAAYTPAASPAPLTGVYLITGGGGAIGMLLAEHLVQGGAKGIVLAGRRELDTERRARIERMRGSGAEVVYLRADVRADDTRRLWQQTKARFQTVNGIFHLAGVLRDAMILAKEPADMAPVLAAKVQGTWLLDRVSRDEPLDFFCCFASFAGVVGNIGQSDYAYANAFMDAFADWRDGMSRRGLRHGRSVSVSWPLWREGGMQIDAAVEQAMARRTGLTTLPAVTAFGALETVLADTDTRRPLVVTGDAERFGAYLGTLSQGGAVPVSRPGPAAPLPPKPAERETTEAIAVVGIAGRYPQAHDLQAFWRNLREGRDCVGEIPAERWDIRAHYDPERGKLGKSYSKWGGFVPDADRFDPGFFGITPRDAELIEPGERLFLEAAWQALEDAGYTQAQLNGRPVGVFAGVMWGLYPLLAIDRPDSDRVPLPASIFSSVANRVSYCFNLTGPSLAMDSMCSGSLSALHQACLAIRRGECEMALAGGTNLSLHPAKYRFLCQNLMLSDDGRCRSFGAGGTGYVPGEGVGAVLLKPLSRALADGDNIHAVIRGSALNHGGRGAGYTVPNPQAQAAVIRAAMADAGVSPTDINYLEAHGTGTVLGDPIEVAGLNSAYGQTGETGYCALGSVKSNIGHLEAAAGIAAVTKVVLQMEQGKLVPSLHSEPQNPKIDLRGTPFRLQREFGDWNPGSRPRMAGISAFGAGGSNAHFVLEEFRRETVAEDGAAVVLPLSARNAAALEAAVRNWVDFLRTGDARNGSVPGLKAIAATVQLGRDAYAERLALVAHDREEAAQALEAYLDGREPGLPLYRGKAAPDAAAVDDGAGPQAVAAAWVKGAGVDWSARWQGRPPRRVSVPGHPQQRIRCWLPDRPAAPAAVQSALHPLVHSNISVMGEIRFATRLTPDHPLIQDHLIHGMPLLPGMAMVEMIRAAAELAGAMAMPMRLVDLVWARPVVVKEEPVEVRTALYPDEGGVLAEVVSGSEEAPLVHCQCRIEPMDGGAAPTLDVDAVNQSCPWELSSEAFYTRCSDLGLGYGPALRSVGDVRHGKDLALARIRHGNAGLEAGYGLAPTVADAALQAVVALVGDLGPNAGFIPYASGRLTLWHPLAEAAYVQVRRTAGWEPDAPRMRFDTAVCDKSGRVLLTVEGFELRRSSAADRSLICGYRRGWTLEPPAAAAEAGTDDLILFGSSPETAAQIAGAHRGRLVRVTVDDEVRRVADDLFSIDPSRPEQYPKLLQALTAANLDTGNIVLSWSLDGNRRPLNQRLEYGVYGLYHLVKALAARNQHKLRLLYLYPLGEQDMDDAAVAGWARALGEENPDKRVRAVGLDDSSPVGAVVQRELAAGDQEAAIRYRHGQRWIHRLLPVDVPVPTPPPGGTPSYRSEGVYLITGGAGGIGALVARHIAESAGATLILTGRSAVAEDDERLAELRKLGSEVEYRATDVTDAGAVEALFAHILERHGRLNGILHCAGVLRDGLLANKSVEEMRQVLAPKVQGTMNLDQASRDLPLDFFTLFSSVSGTLGTAGQTDYGYANAFMDAFADRREALRDRGLRHGHTVSIGWPGWLDGRMRPDDSTIRWLAEHTGMHPLPGATGLKILDGALAGELSHFVPLYGDGGKIERWVAPHLADRQRAPETEAAPDTTARPGLQEKLVQRLIDLLAEETKLPREQIEVDSAFDSYGIDSIAIMNITRVLEADLGPLSKTLFFEYSSIGTLAEHLLGHHGAALQQLFGEAGPAAQPPSPRPPEPAAPAAAGQDEAAPGELVSFSRRKTAGPARFAAPPKQAEPLAIIGLSGRYPEADDLEAFWKNLEEGRDCVREIPPERWPFARYFSPDKLAEGRIYSKWGGFIKDADKFDPLFFNISPAEAEIAGPQERIFLETAWHTVEDAGYSRTALAGKAVGVFVGVMWSQYQLYGGEAVLNGEMPAGNFSHAALPNRVSYQMGWTGPSIAMDTMCSSSLTALHLAMQAIRDGDCEQALVGGVNLSLHPNKYFQLCQRKFLATDGRCRAFGKGGSGYVPGEGVGAILVKPLSRAEADGDHIYGLILSTAINNNGRTNAIMVPSPKAQAEAIRTALERAGLAPEEISYVEAHGTGTALGDPIELTGLVNGFGRRDVAEPFCAVGSVKSNVGHLESAAGIAGITKLLLQFAHGRLVPSIHTQELNPNLDFTGTPFRVQTEATDWTPASGVRRAGLSSFGAGGSNMHVIMEEYRPRPEAVSHGERALFVLSAPDAAGLTRYLQRLADWLAGAGRDADLHRLAYTLQVGREHRVERIAWVVRDLDELKGTLAARLEGRETPATTHQGHLTQGPNPTAQIFEGPEGEAFRLQLIKEGKLDKLAQMWVNGVEPEWEALYPEGRPRRMSLPGYPFDRRRYMLDMRLATTRKQDHRLHPLLTRNTSTFYRHRFEAVFGAGDPWLADHVIQGRPLLPGVVIAEMARAAAAQAAEQPPSRLLSLNLTAPVAAAEDRDLDLTLEITPATDEIEFRLMLGADGPVAATGELDFSVLEPPPVELPGDLLARAEGSFDGAALYQRFAADGFLYGPTLQGVAAVHLLQHGLLVELAAAKAPPRSDDWFLPPAQTDAALQSVRLLLPEDSVPYLPFRLRGLDLYAPLAGAAYAHVQALGACDGTADEESFTIRWMDAGGNLLASLDRLDLRAARQPEAAGQPAFYRRTWREEARRDGELPTPLLVLGGDADFIGDLESKVPELIRVTREDEFRELDPRHYGLNPASEAQIGALVEALAAAGRLPGAILFAPDAELADRAPAEQLDASLYPVLHLTRALMGAKAKAVNLLFCSRLEPAPPAVLAGLGGWMSSLREENPGYRYTALGVTEKVTADEILAELGDCGHTEVRLRDGRREVPAVEAVELPDEAAHPDELKEGGIYLITGGLGGLGFALAKHLVEGRKANLILTGRSSLSEDNAARIAALREGGSEVVYYAADVGDPDDVARLFRKIKARFMALDGIFHTAGVTQDAYILMQSPDRLGPVLGPKIQGSLLIGEAARELQPAFMVLFASVSGLGNPGQSGYAFANAFMDGLARGSAERGRTGELRILSLGWPLWRGLGMQLDAATQRQVLAATGMQPLPSAVGLELLERAVQGDEPQLFPLYGDQARIAGWLNRKVGLLGEPPAVETAPAAVETTAAAPAPAPTPVTAESRPKPAPAAVRPAAPAAPAATAATGTAGVERWLSGLLAKRSKLPVEKIDITAPLDNYGVDSVMVMELTADLEEHLGTLPKTLFYEYPDLKSLGEYLQEQHGEALGRVLGGQGGAAPAARPAAAAQPQRPGTTPAAAPRPLPGPLPRPGAPGAGGHRSPVAVIGLAGRYPMAPDVDAYWDNLVSGRDCVTEIPPERWDYREFYSEDRNLEGKAYSKWGGFIDDPAAFDSGFFSVSPREAVTLDPQERLFLQTAWHCLEEAGYDPASLSGRRIGVYVGVMWGQYQVAGAEAWLRGEPRGIASSSFASIANRVSYNLNLNGPSMALDTMCSSSLTAMKLAMDALAGGEIEMALVGGVNLSLHPNKYQQISLGGFIASDGRCRAFGADGDGYVPGEGIGCVLIKPLNRARRDGDHIHALLRGIAINHGGRSKGYSVPNPRAQAAVIRAALEDAGVEPQSISYVEAHGTGTAQGDPVEIAGLNQGYGATEPDRHPCAIGSAKANIGHLESAAGIAGLTKVLLQLRHRKLAPSIHSDPPNPNIDFAATAFVVQKEAGDWQPQEPGAPLRAGLSSFGAGGSNAHMIIEQAPAVESGPEVPGIQLLPLSARDPEALRDSAAALAAFAQRMDGIPDAPLPADTAYTLQTGRQAMPERLAVVADSYRELAEALEAWLAGRSAANVFAANDDHTSGDGLEQLARTWVDGGDVDWAALHLGRDPLRVSLPTYPFRKRHIWIPGFRPSAAALGAAVTAAMPAPAPAQPAPEPGPGDAEARLQRIMTDVIAQNMMLKPDEIAGDETFDELGMDSVMAGKLTEALNGHLGSTLEPTVFYNYPSPDQLLAHLVETVGDRLPAASAGTAAAGTSQPPAAPVTAETLVSVTPSSVGGDIAIVGFSGRFAGADSAEQLWQNLRNGVDSTAEVPPERWDVSQYYDPKPQTPGKTYSKTMGLIRDMDQFDPGFFGMLPMEATATDPQQRLFLEQAWRALEDAGYSREALAGSRCGVFAGTMTSTYMGHLHEAGADQTAFAMMGIHSAVLPARVSYFVDLKGPCVAMDTACSSSLLAVHLAARALLDGEADSALAGGVFLSLSPSEQLLSAAAGMLSPSGRSATFDDSADGIVIGEGAGVVMLKRLEDALRDGDSIRAVIKASATNQDGKTNGLSSPNAVSQSELEIEVYRRAGINPETISYVETHGTGTKLGDPVEIEGLTRAFRRFTQARQFCPIGSVKPNTGHCYAAAGIASLIKTLLCFRHGELPPSIHCHMENRHLDLAASPFFVNKTLRPWTPPAGVPRRAAVSAFGYSGTNVHLLLEEPPAPQPAPEPVGPQLIVLSARRAALLPSYAGALRAFLAAATPGLPSLGELSHTLQVGRSEFDHRLVFQASTLDEVRSRLDDFLAGRAGGWEAGKVLRRNQRPGRDEVDAALAARDMTALGRLWLKGARVDFKPLYGDRPPRRVSLPGHPFERKRYWPEAFEKPKQAPAPTPGATIESAPRPGRGEASGLVPVDAERLRPAAAEPQAALTPIDAGQLGGGLVRVDIKSFREAAAERPDKQ